jgi:pyruvate dehydrogenase complex dehydrogenase (E1) component
MILLKNPFFRPYVPLTVCDLLLTAAHGTSGIYSFDYLQGREQDNAIKTDRSQIYQHLSVSAQPFPAKSGKPAGINKSCSSMILPLA